MGRLEESQDEIWRNIFQAHISFSADIMAKFAATFQQGDIVCFEGRPDKLYLVS